MRRAVAVVPAVLAVLGPALVAGPVEASTARAPRSDAPAVEVVHRARLTDDGAVSVVLRGRCPAGLQAFELDVAVTQPQASGHVFRSAPPAVLPCDGRPHRTRVVVGPDAGSFTPGRARVDVYVGLYDPVAGHDLEARDSRTVRVRR